VIYIFQSLKIYCGSDSTDAAIMDPTFFINSQYERFPQKTVLTRLGF